MHISLELYKVFYYVAKNMSFSKAGKELFVSQSAVSQSIKQLEEKIDFPLFIRDTKNIRLTRDGESLFEHLKQAFVIIDKAEQILLEKKNPNKGELVIAATDTLCKYDLLPKIKKFNQLYPKIKIKIINGTSLHCLDLLSKGEIDFAIINLNNNVHKKFIIQKSYAFTDVFVSGDKIFNDKTTLYELSKHSLLVLDNLTVTRVYFDKLFKDAGIDITPEIELQNVDILIEMAKARLGIAFVPTYCLSHHHDLHVIDIEEKIETRKYGLVSHEQIPISKLGKSFIDIF